MVQLKIFPPIGIARIGDSPDEWFIGPEVPGVQARPPGGYKSADCRIKRQGARFRIFAFNDDGTPVLEGGHPKEITSAHGEITWSVQLANTKAAAKRFHPIDTDADRNPLIVGAQRETLRIVTELLSISGADQKKTFAQGSFRSLPVPLGELRTDEDGRLIVLGGNGLTRAVHLDGTPWPDKPDPISADGYDADDWHDDVSDGPVRASVVIDGQTHQAAAARVVVAPPAYAPAIAPAVSLYDRLRQLMVDEKLEPLPGTPSFVRDIRPILARARDVTRVFAMPGNHWSVTGAASQPAHPSAGVILSNLIKPGDLPTSAAHMPKLLDDDKTQGFALTPIQYAAVKAWAEGQAGVDWIDDWPGGEPAPDLSITPDGLTEAALEPCIGRGLRPGIEAGRFLTKPENYAEAFRLKDDIAAGEVTSQMAVPWQYDFVICKKEAPFGWWPTHRPDEVFPEAGGAQTGWFTPELNPSGLSGGKWLMENWSRLGFVTVEDGALVETERTIACHDISVVAAREVISEAQAAAALAIDGPEKGRFPAAFVVRVGGSKPVDLGVKSLPVKNLDEVAPSLTLFTAAGSGFTGFTWEPVGVELQSPGELKQTQIVAFVYDIVFTDTGAFSSNGQAIETQDITIAAKKAWEHGEKSGVATGEGRITLTNLEAPWIDDGPVLWLSKDLRVFRVVAGEDPIQGVGPLGADPAAARDWIGEVIEQFNQLPQGNHPFDKLPAEEQESALQVYSATEDGAPVYNFAVARVSYAGKTQPAEDVRVFFRLFTTAATGFEFDPAHAYRRSLDLDAPSPLLGLDGMNRVISIPCFARKRVDSAVVDLAQQKDDPNVRTLFPPLKDQTASHGYFGCWLDINQPDPQFPEQPAPPTPDGPWPAGRQSIQTLINGEHHCLVAEVAFRDTPIPAKATPSDGRIAQRNLVWAEADNPGGPESRTVQHSFMVKAPPRGPAAPLRADELVIHWGGLPSGCRMQVYMPDVEAVEVMALAAETMDYTGLRRLDGHTLECLAGDVTYIPIPSGRTRDAPALLSIEMPEGVRKGQSFRCVVEQVSGGRRVLGAFQLSIPISTARALLGRERRRLSLLRWIAQAKAPDDPWRAVLLRYVDQVAARVKGFGGDPDEITPAPDGNGVAAGPAAEGLTCRLLGGLFALASAATVALGGLDPPPPLHFAYAAVAALILALLWLLACKPGLRRLLLMFGAGVAAGAGLLGVLALLGLGGADIMTWLAASAAIGVFALLAALAWPQPSG